MSFARPRESPLAATDTATLSRDGPCGKGVFDELIALPDVQEPPINAATMIVRFMSEEFRLGGVNAS